jgi:surfactin synthase thioesterase subunit/malonyl CoA-acyl carrier protein transacylase
VGVVELLRRCGVHASAVVGHSVGEVAASYAAGYLTLAQAAYVIYNRGRLLKKTSGRGGMMAVLGNYQDVVEHISDKLTTTTALSNSSNSDAREKKLDIAAVNSPSQVVLSGDREALEASSQALSKKGMKTVVLRVDNAFHSYQQAPLRGLVLKVLDRLSPLIEASAALPMVSSVTASYVRSSQVATPGYWWLNIRQQVRFKDATEVLLNDGYRTFIEIGPHSPLTPVIRETAASRGLATRVTVVPTLQRPKDVTKPADDCQYILRCLASLYVSGFDVDFGVFYPDANHQFVPLPHYPWQREQCLTLKPEMKAARLFPVTAHQLLGHRQQVESDPDTSTASHLVWCCTYTAASVPWIGHHVLQETVVAPAASYIETGLAAGKDIRQGSSITLNNLRFEKFLFASENKATTCTTAKKVDDGQYEVKIFSQDGDGSNWKRHAQMVIKIEESPANESSAATKCLDIEDIRKRCVCFVSKDEFYGRCLEAGGFQLGTSFRVIREGFVSEDCTEALLLVVAPDEVVKEMSSYTFHPAHMDGIMQGYAVLQILRDEIICKRLGKDHTFVVRVPFSVESFKMMSDIKSHLWVHLDMHETNGQSYCDVTVAGADDLKLLCILHNLKFENISSSETGKKIEFWSLAWTIVDQEVEVKLDEKQRSGNQVLLIGFQCQSMDRLCGAFEAARATVHSLRLSDSSSSKTWQVKIQQALTAAATNQVDHVVVLVDGVGMRQSSEGLSNISKEAFLHLEMQALLPTVFALQHFITETSSTPPSFWLITITSRHVVNGDPVNVISLPAIGLVVTASCEQRDFTISTVDITGDGYRHLVHYIFNSLTTENEVALRPSPANCNQYDVYACRVLDDIHEASLKGNALTSNWTLQKASRGEELRFTIQSEMGAPVNDELVTVKVSTFAPVQNSQAGECVSGWVSGYVISCSDSLSCLKCGDQVTGFVSKIESYKTLPYNQLVLTPSVLSCEEATALARDVAFPYMVLTAGVALKPGELILVYVDSSGHGLHFCQVALNMGAKVVAVMATQANDVQIEHKDSFHSILASDLGSHLSTETEFSVKTADAVFVAQAPDAVALDLISRLKLFGVSIDYKRENPLNPNNDRPYRSLVINPSLTNSNGYIRQELLKSLVTVLELAAEGTNGWRSSVVQSVSVSCIQNNSELTDLLLGTGGITTRPVISCSEEVSFTIPSTVGAFKLDSGETHLVTGGMKGFGLSLSQWLVEQGARHLVLLGRSPPSQEASAVIDQMVAQGVNVCTYQVDVSVAEAMDSLITEISEQLPPLAGIFHCATVYSDHWLSSLTEEHIRVALEAKCYGALLLHQHTVHRRLKVKYFVLFSSMVSFIGNAGQSSYCAANTFLNALADYRHQTGLSATAVQFGPISDAGYLSQNSRVMELWVDKGFTPMKPRDALDAMGRALTISPSQVAIQAQLNKRKFFAEVRPWLKINLSRYKHMIPMEILTDSVDEQTSIMAIPKEQRQTVVKERLMSLIEEKLGVSCPQPTSSLVSMGLDSVGATDLSLQVNGRFGVNMQPVRLLNNLCTIESLSESIVKVLEQKRGSTVTDGTVDGNSKHNSQEMDTKWLLTLNSQVQAKMSLICFPPNAFGASSFANWDGVCSQNGIELTVVRFPGWLGREQEQCIDNLDQLVSEAINVLLPLLSQRPFAFYGQSMGALIAYEVTHRLVAKQHPVPCHFFAGGWFAPHIPYPHPNDFNIPDSIFRKGTSISLILEHTAKFKFIEKNPRLFKERHPLAITKLKWALPCLQAGLSICKRYVSGARRLPCPVTVFSARDDEFVTADMMEPWKMHACLNEDSSPMFKHLSVDGNHFFTVSKYRDITTQIIMTLEK